MTRAEEEARILEVDAMEGVSDRFKTDFRQSTERRHMLEDAGVTELWRWKSERDQKEMEKTWKTLGW